MYGTIARFKIARDKLEKLREESDRQMQRQVAGFRMSHLLIPDDRDDEVYLVVFFDDRESYTRNADDPAQHQDYLRIRALLDSDPEWIDGEWTSWEA
jgi:heme-degrading monooxygenase HmoA